MTVQENRPHFLQGGASLNSKDGVDLATGGVLTQKNEGCQGLHSTMHEGLFRHVMEIELDLKRKWKIGGGWEPQKRY